MKKYLSLLVVMAMVLTTLALPVAVSADEVVPAGIGSEAIAITYAVKNASGAVLDKVRPGEKFNLVISAQVTSAEKITAFSIGVPYDTNAFTASAGEITYGDLFTTAEIIATSVEGKGLSLIYDQNDTGISVSEQAGIFEIATIPFTVSNTAEAKAGYSFGEDIIAAKANESISFIEMTNESGYFEYTVSSNKASLAVEANTVTVTVDGSPLEMNKTYYKEGGVTLAVAGTGITAVTLQKDQGDEVDHFSDYSAIQVTESGSYTLKVTTPEGTKTYTFSVFAQAISANIAVTATPAIADKNGAVSLTAAMEDIVGPAGAAMVSFDVAYDVDSVEFNGVTPGADVPQNQDAVKAVKNENGKVSVIYGDKNSEVEANAVTKGQKFIVLNFTVKADAVSGAECVFAMSNAKAAMYNTAPSADNFAATITNSASITISSGDPLIVGSYPAEYSKDAYDLSVLVNGTGAKYAPAAELQGVSGDENIKAWLALEGNGTAIGTGNQNIRIEKEGDYYVLVTLASGETSLIKLLNENLKLDQTGPEIVFTNVSAQWRAISSLDVTSLTATDTNMPDTLEFFYYLGTTDEPAAVTTPVPTEPAAINLTNLEAETITFKTADKLGNAAVQTFSIKADNMIPAATLTKAEGTVKPANTVTLNLTAADGGSGIAAEAIAVKRDGAATDLSIALSGGTGSVAVTQNGTYSVDVVDNVGNAVTKEVTVDEIEAATVPALKAAVNTAAATKAGLLTNSALQALGFADNGTYKYLKIEADATAAGYTTTIAVTKDTMPLAAASTYTLTEAGKYVITVTTTSATNAAVTASETYTVNIGDLPSINKDGIYNIVDYAVMKTFITKSVEPSAGIFQGGYFSGDVTGDFKNDIEDYTKMLDALKHMAKKADYGTYFEIAK